MKKKSHINNEKGFVLLYAVLVTMVIVTVGVLMINIVTRQIVLSSVAKNSQVAFYAANAGLDCAFHYYSESLFGSKNTEGDFIPPDDTLNINCDGPRVVNNLGSDGYFYSWSFLVNNNSCVDVEVSLDNDGRNFKIESNGYNATEIVNSKCKINNLGRLTQRTIVVNPAEAN